MAEQGALACRVHAGSSTPHYSCTHHTPQPCPQSCSHSSPVTHSFQQCPQGQGCLGPPQIRTSSGLQGGCNLVTQQDAVSKSLNEWSLSSVQRPLVPSLVPPLPTKKSLLFLLRREVSPGPQTFWDSVYPEKRELERKTCQALPTPVVQVQP